LGGLAKRRHKVGGEWLVRELSGAGGAPAGPVPVAGAAAAAAAAVARPLSGGSRAPLLAAEPEAP